MSSWRGSRRMPRDLIWAVHASSRGLRVRPRQLRVLWSKQGINCFCWALSALCGRWSSTPRFCSSHWMAWGMPWTNVWTSVGSATPPPTVWTVSMRSCSSSSLTGPMRPRPQVPGKKLDPLMVLPALATATVAPARAASMAAQRPAMPDPITSTSVDSIGFLSRPAHCRTGDRQ